MFFPAVQENRTIFLLDKNQMKSIFFLILAELLLIATISAQDVKPTSQGSTCQNCLPNGWIKDAGASNSFPSISNETHYAGLANQPWSPLPEGPAPSFLGSFLSAYVSPTASATCHTSLTGLTPNKTYYLRYHIMSSKREDDPGYGDTGKLELASVLNGVPTPFTSQITTFTPGVNTGKWISKVLEFTPTSSNIRLTFSGASSTGGFVNLDIGFNALTECLTGTDQVSLSSNDVKTTCDAGANLTSLVQGSLASGVSIVWFTNPSHTGEKYSQPAAAVPGTYYAFKYHNLLDCYNTDLSTAKLTVEQGCYDLSPTVEINGLNFSVGTSRDFVVNVFEISGASTNNPTVFRITKPSAFEITYEAQSGISNVLGGRPNENSKWLFSENVNYITAICTSEISGAHKSTIGFKIKRKNGIPSGTTQNITAVIQGGSGNESDTSNNTAITSVSTN
jgi:hypothetical protein